MRKLSSVISISIILLALVASSCGPKVDLDEYARISGAWTPTEITVKGRFYLGQEIPDTTLKTELGTVNFMDCDPRDAKDGCPIEQVLVDGTKVNYTFVMSWANDDREVILSWPESGAPDNIGWQGSYTYDLSENTLTLTGINGSSELAGRYNGQLLDIKLSR